MADLDKIKAKVRALRSMTAEAGCTEAEALAAAAAAARIMAEHGLADADISISSERARETTSRATWRSHVSATVAHVTNTAAILLPDDEAIEFFGRDPAPEIAAYLYQVLCRAVEREREGFKHSPDYRRRRSPKTRRSALTDFTAGMVARLRLRLLALFRDVCDESARAIAAQSRDAAHRDTAPWDQKARPPRFSNAVAAGWVAGGQVTLAHGLGAADGQPLAITKGERA